MEQNPCICNILRFYRSYKIMNIIMEQFSHISLQFVANVYKDNMINEWDYTYWQVTVHCIDHVECCCLGNWVANSWSRNL